MLTLVATAPNPAVNSELERQGIAGFGLFGITPFGLPILALCIGYVLVARRWLPRVRPSDSAASRPLLRDWIAQYGLADRELRRRVKPRSILAGRRVEDVAHREQSSKLLAIERARNFAVDVIRPVGRTGIEAGDVLLVDAPHEDIGDARLDELGVERLALEGGGYRLDRSQDIGMVEAIVPAASAGSRRSACATAARSCARGCSSSACGSATRCCWWASGKTSIGSRGQVRPRAAQRPGAVRGDPAGGVVNVHAVLIGCLLMGLFGRIDMSSAHRAVSFKTILLIVGMMPFSLALERTGAVDMAANGLVAAVGDAAPQVVLAALFIVTAGLGLFISNTATAVLMAPVGLAVAQDLGASPYPFAMTTAFAWATAFMTPVSTPLNTLVIGPDGYKFGDFVRLGVPFSLVVLVFTVIAVPILLPLCDGRGFTGRAAARSGVGSTQGRITADGDIRSRARAHARRIGSGDVIKKHSAGGTRHGLRDLASWGEPADGARSGGRNGPLDAANALGLAPPRARARAVPMGGDAAQRHRGDQERAGALRPLL